MGWIPPLIWEAGGSRLEQSLRGGLGSQRVSGVQCLDGVWIRKGFRVWGEVWTVSGGFSGSGDGLQAAREWDSERGEGLHPVEGSGPGGTGAGD